MTHSNGHKPLDCDWPDHNQDGNTSSVPDVRRAQSTRATNGAGHAPLTSKTTTSRANGASKSSGTATTADSREGRVLSDLHKAALNEKRKLDPALCERLGFWSPPGGALAFDYLVSSKIHNTKLRRGKGDMPWMQSSKSLVLWNLDCLAPPPSPDEFVIVTEGEIDGASCIQAGFQRVVSVPNGAQANEGGFKYLYQPGPEGELLADISKFGRFVLALDSDAKGRACRDAMALRLGADRCQVVTYPDGCKDANDVLVKHGPSRLAECLLSTKPMWTDTICKLSDIPEPALEVQYRTGFFELDRWGLKITLPCFMPLIGPYGSGKSVFVRQLAYQLWQLHGWPFLLTAWEERIKPRYRRDFRRLIIGKPQNEWTDEEIVAADAELDRAGTFFRREKHTTIDGEALLSGIKYAAKVYGIKVAIIDPINAMSHVVPRGQNKTDYMGELIERLKDLGDDYGLLTIVCVHPPKEGVEKRLKSRGLLTLNDGADTAHWGNKADLGMCMWRNINRPTLLHIDKVKDYETMGRPTLAELSLDKQLNRFRVERLGYDIIKPKVEDV